MLCYSLYISDIVCIFQLYISIFVNNPMPCEVTVICCITVWLLLCWGAWKLWSFDTFVLRTSDVKFDKNLFTGTGFKDLSAKIPLVTLFQNHKTCGKYIDATLSPEWALFSSLFWINFRQDIFRSDTPLASCVWRAPRRKAVCSCNVSYCCPLLTKTVTCRQTLVIFPVSDFMKIRSATLELSSWVVIWWLICVLADLAKLTGAFFVFFLCPATSLQYKRRGTNVILTLSWFKVPD